MPENSDGYILEKNVEYSFRILNMATVNDVRRIRTRAFLVTYYKNDGTDSL